MLLTELKPGDKGHVTALHFSISDRKTLLCKGLCLGAEIRMNYSPMPHTMINLTVGDRIISLRRRDSAHIEVFKTWAYE